jgi:hypothetical protein
MLKKIAIWGAVAVAAVLAVQLLMRTGPPKSLFVPPKMQLPGLYRAPEGEPSQPAEQGEPERGADTAAEEAARADNAAE